MITSLRTSTKGEAVLKAVKQSPLDVIRHGKDIQVSLHFHDLSAPPKTPDVPRVLESEGIEFAEDLGLDVQKNAEIRDVELDERINEGRQEHMRKQHIEATREGRGDTGFPLWGKEGLHRVCIEGLTRDITTLRRKHELPYALVHVGVLVMPARNRRGKVKEGLTLFEGKVYPACLKTVVRLTFSNTPPSRKEPWRKEALHNEDERAILEAWEERVYGLVWKRCDIWDNNANYTINLHGGEDTESEEGFLLRYHPKPEELKAVQEGEWNVKRPFYLKPVSFVEGDVDADE